MRFSARVALGVVATAVLALALAPRASAHVANIEYRFPLPVWVYALAGAAAVVASFPAAALGIRNRPERLSCNLYPQLVRLR